MSGFVGTALSYGSTALSMVSITKQRGFFPTNGSDTSPFYAMAVVEEQHGDDMEITDHPIEIGANISDHAYKRPSEVMITCGWSDSPNDATLGGALAGMAAANSQLAAQLINAYELVVGVAGAINGAFGTGQSVSQQAYAKLLSYQQNRVMFTINTGKRKYSNMMIKSLATTTDRKSENMMIIRISCREILMAQTQSVNIPDASVMSNPSQNAAPVPQGTVSLQPAPNFNSIQA